MQVVKSYPDGVFSWVDLGTSDTDAGKRFYSELFGWSFLDLPTDSGNVYSMAQLEGYNIAGLGPMDPDMQAQGVPPFWTCYVKHDDVDAVASESNRSGWHCHVPPFRCNGLRTDDHNPRSNRGNVRRLAAKWTHRRTASKHS